MTKATHRRGLTLAAMGAMSALALAHSAQAQATRDPWKWPFAATSIWNQPIGSGAQYVGGVPFPVSIVQGDDEYQYQSNAGDPYRPVYRPDSTTTSYVSINIPDSYTTHVWNLDPAHYYTPNNCAEWLRPDGYTLVHLQPLLRPTAGSIVQAWYPGHEENLFGAGIVGSHFGSLLSGLGGSIRKGELEAGGPLRHALKIEYDTNILYKAADGSGTYRWPALNADGDTSQYGVVNTNEPDQCMGALMAVPPGVTESSLGLVTTPGKKIFHALQDYGAYIVDTTGAGWKPNGGYPVNFGVENGVQEEFQGAYGTSFSTGSGDWKNDIAKIAGALQVVHNSTPSSIGGGGSPRVTDPIPPFAYGGALVGVSQNLPGQVEAANYDVGGEGVGYHDTDAQNSGNGYRNDGVDIRNSAVGGYQVGWISPGEWLKFGVNVTAGTYTLNFHVASGANGGSLHLEDEGGNNLTGAVSFGGTGGYDTFTTVSVPNVALSGGQHTYSLVFDSGGFDIHWWSATVPSSGFGNGYYQIVSKNSGKVIDVSGVSKTHGATVWQWDYVGGANQQWQFVPTGDGYYTVVSRNSGMVLDAWGQGTANGTQIVQWDAWGGDNQKWLPVDIGGGYYKIVGKQSGRCLDVSGASMANGGALQLYDYVGAANQQWRIVSVQ